MLIRTLLPMLSFLNATPDEMPVRPKFRRAVSASPRAAEPAQNEEVTITPVVEPKWQGQWRTLKHL